MIILEADMKALRGVVRLATGVVGGVVGGLLGSKKKKASVATAAPPPQSRDDVTDRIIISRGFARQRRGALGDQLFGSGGLEPMSPPSLGSGG
jgi:hypothetical protein